MYPLRLRGGGIVPSLDPEVVTGEQLDLLSAGEQLDLLSGMTTFGEAEVPEEVWDTQRAQRQAMQRAVKRASSTASQRSDPGRDPGRGRGRGVSSDRAKSGTSKGSSKARALHQGFKGREDGPPTPHPRAEWNRFSRHRTRTSRFRGKATLSLKLSIRYA